MTGGKDQIVLVTERGQALRFSEEDIPSMGRAASGVMGVKLAKGDRVAAMDVVDPKADLLVVTERDEITLISAEGMVLRTTVKNISSMGRATKGVVIMGLKEEDTVASLARINKKGRK